MQRQSRQSKGSSEPSEPTDYAGHWGYLSLRRQNRCIGIVKGYIPRQHRERQKSQPSANISMRVVSTGVVVKNVHAHMAVRRDRIADPAGRRYHRATIAGHPSRWLPGPCRCGQVAGKTAPHCCIRIGNSHARLLIVTIKRSPGFGQADFSGVDIEAIGRAVMALSFWCELRIDLAEGPVLGLEANQ